MARNDPQVNFRIPAELNELLKEAAANNNRTITAELVNRLEKSFAEGGNAESTLYLRRNLAEYRQFWSEILDLLAREQESKLAAQAAGVTDAPSFHSEDGRAFPIEKDIAATAETIDYFTRQRDQATMLLAEIAYLEAVGRPMTDAALKQAIADRKIEMRLS